MEVIRAVLDTNILARAAKRGAGPAREVLTRVRLHPHCLITSPYLLNELERVLTYPRVRALHRLSHEEMQAYLVELHQISDVVSPSPGDPAQPLSTDPDDNPIIQSAVLGRASHLCTRDRHLKQANVVQYCSEHSITICSDLELLTVLRQFESAPG